ncbi:MAG: ClpXP protease specificity-enhancing factor SspB [Lactobacillaceae bacterium]|jgi:hypothetical protein|nr:ClpXP protease specificity-enhancing factor SspB [Lactobacillaceae bacterium]
MTVYVNDINYDFLVEKALKNVIKDALKIVEVQGFPGDHHFYVAFKTNHPNTEISGMLKSQYPEEMTIVMQHQYKDLEVFDDAFSVELQFGGISQKLKIPFDAIVYFADPSTRFGLSFGSDDDEKGITDTTDKMEETRKVSNEPATIVSIDEFRKKKN